jgi:hypothetical protein
VALIVVDGFTDSISPLWHLRRLQRLLTIGFFLQKSHN